MKKLNVSLTGLAALNALSAQEAPAAADRASADSSIGLSAGLELGAVDIAGEAVFSIKPELDIKFKKWTLCARTEFFKLDEVDEWVLSPFVGASYSF